VVVVVNNNKENAYTLVWIYENHKIPKRNAALIIIIIIIIIMVIIIIILVISFMRGIYNYIPETNPVSRVCNVAAVLYLHSVLHVMFFRPWDMFCTFTSALSAVCVQCLVWLFFKANDNNNNNNNNNNYYYYYFIILLATAWSIRRWNPGGNDPGVKRQERGVARAIPLLPFWAFMAGCRGKFTFLFSPISYQVAAFR